MVCPPRVIAASVPKMGRDGDPANADAQTLALSRHERAAGGRRVSDGLTKGEDFVDSIPFVALEPADPQQSSSTLAMVLGSADETAIKGFFSSTHPRRGPATDIDGRTCARVRYNEGVRCTVYRGEETLR